MPTNRFTNLQEEKRTAISKAVIDEFICPPYGDLKISQIARRACISRGSVYTYFRDREDLFRYAMERLLEQGEPGAVTLKTLIIHHGGQESRV